MANSILTPLQMTAGEGLLQNQGLAPSTEFANAIVAYDTCSLIDPLREAMTAAGNAYPTLFTIGANTCPALGDSVPSAYSLPTSPTGWVDSFTTVADLYLGNGDLSKFAQAESICQGYADTVNPYINSAVNSQTYLANTFTNTNNMVTGDITSVNLATSTWGTDLLNLGKAINLNNLNDLGSPLALTKQLAAAGGLTADYSIMLANYGVPIEVVININSPTLSVVDSVQKLMYTAMTKITGTSLTEILTILKVKTVGIETMADLLNPYKLFPNSFQTLTVTNLNGVSENIYLDNQGTVNMAVVQGLPTLVVSSL
jgi:hypothetical protein